MRAITAEMVVRQIVIIVATDQLRIKRKNFIARQKQLARMPAETGIHG